MKIYRFFSFPLFVVCLGCVLNSGLTAQERQLEQKSDARIPLEEIAFEPGIFFTPLPDEVEETSGLIFWEGSLWTHNDSGGEAALYRIDTATGNIVGKVTLADCSNVDWEDIAQDDTHIFIGDFGNNRGTRKDLKVIRIPKEIITGEKEQEITCDGMIRFSYADQQSFDKRKDPHNFDCEAMIAFGDSLYLFTKNWGNRKTRCYALPKTPGDYRVSPKKHFNAKGLITGAALSPNNKQLVLTGYQDYVAFAWLFTDFAEADFFRGQRLNIDFPELVFVQTEGVCFVNDNDVIISCENSAEPQQLYQINTGALQQIADSRLGNHVDSDIVIAGMPESVSEILKVDILKVPQKDFTVELRNVRWSELFREQYVWNDKNSKMRISILVDDLKPGPYFLRIVSGDQKTIKKIEVQH